MDYDAEFAKAIAGGAVLIIIFCVPWIWGVVCLVRFIFGNYIVHSLDKGRGVIYITRISNGGRYDAIYD